VRSLRDVVDWDQVIASDLLEEISPIDGDPYTVVDPPFTVGGPLHYRIPAPRLGEHTLEVLSELQIPSDRVEELAREGVVRTGTHE
jgi:crotonobetainyl-CoA:carnitine CoA-transferase CaiB-like acyl-CoA transferase